MDIKENIAAQMRAALKAGQKKRLSVLRMLLSELKVAEASGEEYEELDVVRAYARKLRKNAAEYEDLSLAEKAQEARGELAVVEEFLPRQMSVQQIEELIEDAIREHNYGPGDLGRLMSQIMSEHRDVVDGRVVHEIARRKFSGKQ